ncbi:hypothetical protein AV953_gp06 [Thermus virus IN93]|uniref:Uncharacterized protein n=1 Tax=Thermus virus IN93 TaxID=1714273 RepID=Q859T5_9VIRU|nr:hypothetical protein AV953_gp06 [Thermus virus IN93]BAC55286.1 hypothetical protein [Thermus virus IN93]
MAYQRVPVDPNAPLRPGKTYEIVAAHKGGDVSRVTRADLERALQARYGPGVRVLDWGKRGDDLVIRLKVEATSSSGTSDPWAVPPAYGGAGCGSIRCPQPMDYLGGGDIYPAFLPALVLSAAAVIAILYLVWRIVAELKEAVELVPAPARAAAVAGAGVGVGALGLAALGVVALALLGRRGRRAYA